MILFLTTILSVIWIYGGAYAASLATASSFFAVFFFFWTRTGKRKDTIDLATKKIYLHAIYTTLRVSLYVIILSKIIEIGFMTLQSRAFGISATPLDIIISQNGLFIYMILVLLAINSFAMQKRWINFSFALPFAVVSYGFLFLHITSQAYFGDRSGFFIPAGQTFVMDMTIYISALVIGTIVFNHFSHKRIGTHAKIAEKK